MEWEFKFSNEDLVGDFWRLIETPVQKIPGAWPDSDSDSDYQRPTRSDTETDDELFADDTDDD